MSLEFARNEMPCADPKVRVLGSRVDRRRLPEAPGYFRLPTRRPIRRRFWKPHEGIAMGELPFEGWLDCSVPAP
jgi:hypothetical protein